MLTLLNAQERSAAEFRALFAAASPGFRFDGVTRPKGCRMSIIEAVWEGEDYGGEMPTPVDTPLVTPIDAKTSQDKELPLVSTTKAEPKIDPKIEDNEHSVEQKETSEANTILDTIVKEADALTLDSAASSTSSASAASPTTTPLSVNTLA